MKTKKYFALIILTIATTVFFTGCGSFNNGSAGNSGSEEEKSIEGERFSDTYFDVFDTVTSLIAYCEDKDSFDKLTKEAHSMFRHYHQLFDIYKTYDGLNNARTINKNAGKEPVQVDPELIELIEFSKEVYERTDGKVNIAMGAVLSLWHEARTEGMENPDKAFIPDIDELKKAALHCNINDILIDKEAGTVFLKDPEMSLDLGAIAKGFAAEKVAHGLEDLGYKSLVLSLGGNVRAVGTKGLPDEDLDRTEVSSEDGSQDAKWLIAIQNPDTESENAYIDKIEVEDASIVTSGVYQRYYEVEGKRYHHIIDPETLMPEDRYLSLTIKTKDSGLADALSTGVFNMSFDEGKAFVESMEGVEALWVFPDESMERSSGWESYQGE